MLSYYLRRPLGRAKVFFTRFGEVGPRPTFRTVGPTFQNDFEKERVAQHVFFISVGCVLGQCFFYVWQIQKHVKQNPARNGRETVPRKTYKNKSRQIQAMGNEAKVFFICFSTVSGRSAAGKNNSWQTLPDLFFKSPSILFEHSLWPLPQLFFNSPSILLPQLTHRGGLAFSCRGGAGHTFQPS